MNEVMEFDKFAMGTSRYHLTNYSHIVTTDGVFEVFEKADGFFLVDKIWEALKELELLRSHKMIVFIFTLNKERELWMDVQDGNYNSLRPNEKLKGNFNFDVIPTDGLNQKTKEKFTLWVEGVNPRVLLLPIEH